MEKFVKEQMAFYNYYKTGRTEFDEEYFLRANNDLSNFICARPYDLVERATTSHDHLVAKILALERFANYSVQRLEELIGNNPFC